MECEVLIVGAGPVGLMLGCELARRGVSHLIVESKGEREDFCKALGVSPRSMEIFDQLGLLDEIRRRGFHFSAMNIVVGGELVQHSPAQDASLPYGYFGIAQPDTERVLERYWSSYANEVHRNCKITKVEQSESQVEASTEDGQTIRARYLVGCDGAHSTVRKQLGTPFEGDRYPMTFLLGDMKIEWDRPHRDNWQFIQMENGELRNVVTLIANPTGEGRYRVSTAVEDGFKCEEHPSLEVLSQIVAPALPAEAKLSDLRWSSRYNISHRIAGFYRKARVFLAGDAAHIHPPIGGLGMNTGLQDAYNLGWKLAGVIKGSFSEKVLDTYQSERLPVGQKVVEITAARMEKATGGKPEVKEPPHFDSQLFITYSPNLVVGEPTGADFARTGERLPLISGLKRPHTAGEVHFPELFRNGRFQLFFTSASDGVATTAQRVLGESVNCWKVCRLEEQAEDFGGFIDSREEWTKALGNDALLVRPDGVIGWRGERAEQFEDWLNQFVE